MSRDICAQIVISAGDRDKRGKILSVVRAADVATLAAGEYSYNEAISSSRCAFVFVVDVPSSVKIRRLLAATYLTGVKADTLEHEYLYKFRAARITDTQRQSLLSSRQITIPWTTFRDSLYNRKLLRTAAVGDLE